MDFFVLSQRERGNLQRSATGIFNRLDTRSSVSNEGLLRPRLTKLKKTNRDVENLCEFLLRHTAIVGPDVAQSRSNRFRKAAM